MSGPGAGPMSPNYRRVKIVRNFTKDATTAKSRTVEIKSIKCVDTNVELLKGVDTDVEPIKSIETYVEPIRCVHRDVEPIKGVDTYVEPIRRDITDVEPIKCVDTDIEPIRGGVTDVEPIKCVDTDIDPINCDITYVTDVERIKNAVPEPTSGPMTKESVVASPVDESNSENTSTDGAQSASTSNLIDELFKEFLAVKMETIEAEYHAVQEAQKQQLLKTENTSAVDSSEAIKGESNDVASPRRKRHHSKDKTHKSKHKSRHKSSKPKKERSRLISHVEENSDKTDSIGFPAEGTDIVTKTEKTFCSREDIGTAVDTNNARNGLDTANSTLISESVVISSTAQKAWLPVDVDKINTKTPISCASSLSDRESVVEGATDKHGSATDKNSVPIVRVFSVKGAKADTDKPGEDTISGKSKTVTHEASSKPEKEDPLWDFALSGKASDSKGAEEIPQGVFDTKHVKGKQHVGFTFGLKITTESADRISRRNREEGEVSSNEASDHKEDVDTESGSASDGGDAAEAEKMKKRKHKHKKKRKHKRCDDDGDSASKKRPRSTSRSRTPKHRRSRSRSLSTSRSHGNHKGRHHSSRSRSRERHQRSRSRERDHRRHGQRSRSRGRHRSPLKDFYRGWRARSRSRTRDGNAGKKKSSGDLRVKIDKAKLRQIAMSRVFNNMQTEQGAAVELKSEQIAALKAGGHSVQELTDFCQKLSQKDKHRNISSDETSVSSEEEQDTSTFIHHPFKLRDNQPNIVMNIANAKQLPILTPAMKATLGTELRVLFPVSSGTQHRVKEWVVVEKPKPANGTAVKGAVPKPTPEEDKVFPTPPPQSVSIGDVVSERLSALRNLKTNPYDVQALTKMHRAERQGSSWASSKLLPGQFTGSTDIHVLSQQELHGGYHAWARKDQFTRATPVLGGIGLSLLQKMGWKQGFGLGKDNNGSVEPLSLSVKMDRKGLSSMGESTKRQNFPVAKTRKDLSGKHPISALVELCNKRKWMPPDFIIVQESGPDHKKHFIMKVMVNRTEYQPTVSCGTKKLAKAEAATVCLQQLGLIPQ